MDSCEAMEIIDKLNEEFSALQKEKDDLQKEKDELQKLVHVLAPSIKNSLPNDNIEKIIQRLTKEVFLIDDLQSQKDKLMCFLNNQHDILQQLPASVRPMPNENKDETLDRVSKELIMLNTMIGFFHDILRQLKK